MENLKTDGIDVVKKIVSCIRPRFIAIVYTVEPKNNIKGVRLRKTKGGRITFRQTFLKPVLKDIGECFLGSYPDIKSISLVAGPDVIIRSQYKRPNFEKYSMFGRTYYIKKYRPYQPDPTTNLFSDQDSVDTRPTKAELYHDLAQMEYYIIDYNGLRSFKEVNISHEQILDNKPKNNTINLPF